MTLPDESVKTIAPRVSLPYPYSLGSPSEYVVHEVLASTDPEILTEPLSGIWPTTSFTKQWMQPRLSDAVPKLNVTLAPPSWSISQQFALTTRSKFATPATPSMWIVSENMA